MTTRVAVISIIVEQNGDTEGLNHLLSEYGNYIIGRMGIPYRAKKINIISVAIDAPQDVTNTLTGKIGQLRGISSKTAYSKTVVEVEE
jgi:putative iron-only hydrogenase system regulator